MYNGMRLSDFSLCYDILSMVNKIKKSNLFNIYGINYTDKVICDNKNMNIINMNKEKTNNSWGESCCKRKLKQYIRYNWKLRLYMCTKGRN